MRLLRKLVLPYGHILGVTLIIVSFAAWLLPAEHKRFSILTVFTTIFGAGTIILCDYIDYKLSGSSILLSKRKLRLFFNFGVPALFAGIIIDFFAQWLAKFWSFNDVPYWFYPVYMLGYYFYFLMVSETYFATKSILDYLFKRPKLRKGKWVESYRFKRSLLFAGILLIALPTYYYVEYYFNTGGYFHNLGVPTELNFSIIPLISIGFGFWFLFEAIALFQGKNTLLKDLARGYWRPLWAILLACFWYGVLMEVWNEPLQYYSYSNFGLLTPLFLGVPVIVLLMWPLHYLPLLTLYRIQSKSLLEDPWEYDSIRSK